MQKNGKRDTMSKSSKTLLIATGCSFTDFIESRYLKPGIDTWPDLVAEFMDWDLINVGKGGSGNDYICNAAIDAILENSDRDIVVMVLWTNATRLDFFDKNTCSIVLPDEFKHRVDEIKFPENIRLNKELHESNCIPSLKWMVKHTIRNIWTLNTICKFNNIKIINARYLNFMPRFKKYQDSEMLHNEMMKIYFENDYITKEELDLSTLMGNTKYWISPDDNHPNQLGHEVISHDFMKKYREKYE